MDVPNYAECKREGFYECNSIRIAYNDYINITLFGTLNIIIPRVHNHHRTIKYIIIIIIMIINFQRILLILASAMGINN